MVHVTQTKIRQTLKQNPEPSQEKKVRNTKASQEKFAFILSGEDPSRSVAERRAPAQ
jgi:hypothetical protein